MSGEIRVIGATGNTGYVHLFNSSGQRWNGSSFESFNVLNYADYDVSVTEDGATGVYRGDMPSTVPAGSIDVVLFMQDGASPANGDRAVGAQSITDWSGSSSAPASTPLGSLTGLQMKTYIVNSGFKRDDMDSDIYDALTDTIMEMEQAFRFDEREKETTSTDIITAADDNKINLESDMGHLISVTLIDGDTTTPLCRLSKAAFDLLYSTPTSGMDTGYPKHFCVFAGQIQIGPCPDSLGYAYRQAYSQRLTSVIDATTSPVPFSAQYREILKDGAMYRLLKNLKHFDLASYHKNDFGEGMTRAMMRERRNRGGTFNVAYNDI